MSPQTIADDLKAARAVLERGWCKDALEDSAGGHCALGAIALVTTGSAYGWGDRSHDPAHLVAEQLPSGMVADLIEFNNAPETTHQDVLDLFDAALANLPAEMSVVFTPGDAADLARAAERFEAEVGVSA